MKLWGGRLVSRDVGTKMVRNRVQNPPQSMQSLAMTGDFRRQQAMRVTQNFVGNGSKLVDRHDDVALSVVRCLSILSHNPVVVLYVVLTYI